MKIEEMKIVCIGGGTGMSTMLRGLKAFTRKITAIVTVADNGGSSGILRKEMNILPPGDIRNCLLALAETEPMMDQVFQYRFSEGSLKGQNLGNLFIAALTEICGNFEEAIEKANEILRVTGQVLPVTGHDVQLMATYEDGAKIVGEHEIVFVNKVERKRIQEVELLPANPQPNAHAVQAIMEADLIILGPGSLYTSIIPNLLVDQVAKRIQEAPGHVMYVANMMTQPGETDGYSLTHHLQAIEQVLGKGVIDQVVVNNQPIDPKTLALYKEDGAIPVVNDLKKPNYQVIEGAFVEMTDEEHYIRHNSRKLARIIIESYHARNE